ncbi:MAG: universal stress protein [Caldisericia bacterium]|nr:universal stress protein [Caldisericia bacterium]
MNKLFEKILVSLEPSEEWKIFLSYLTKCFKDSKFYILSVIDTTKFIGRGIKLYEDYLTELIEKSLKDYEELLNEKKVDFEIVLRKGRVKDSVFDEVKEKGIDLLVIGSHSAVGVKRLKLGGIAKDILINSHIPVLVMNALVEPSLKPKILNPTTGSQYSYEATIFSLKYAKNFNGNLTVLFLIKDEKIIENYMERVKIESEKLSIDVNFKIFEKDPLESILESTKEHDLIIGSRGYKGFKYKLRNIIKEFSLDYIVRSTITLSEKPILLICD